MMTQMNPKLPMKQNDDFLCHHGTKGQKWGVRRYQEKDGSLTPLGRIHWGIGPERKAAIKKKFTLAKDNVKKLALKAKTKHEENVKLRKEKQEQSIANKKAKLLGKGDPAEIHKNRALFSDAELDQAMNRIKKLQDLKSMDPKQKEAVQKLQQTQQNRQVVKDGRSTVDKIVSAGKAAVGIAGTAIAVYQSYNKIAGAINEISGKDQLPTFDLNPWSKKDTDKKKDNQGSDNKGTDKKSSDKKFKAEPFDSQYDAEVNASGGIRAGKKASYLTGYKAVDNLNLDVVFDKAKDYAMDLTRVPAPKGTTIVPKTYNLGVTGQTTSYDGRRDALNVITDAVWNEKIPAKILANIGYNVGATKAGIRNRSDDRLSKLTKAIHSITYDPYADNQEVQNIKSDAITKPFKALNNVVEKIDKTTSGMGSAIMNVAKNYGKATYPVSTLAVDVENMDGIEIYD